MSDPCCHMSIVLLYSSVCVSHIFRWTECRCVPLWAGKSLWPFGLWNYFKAKHYFLKCMAVNLTLSIFVLIQKNLTFLERNDVLPAAAWCDILSVLNHIGAACASGIRQTRLWVSRWLSLMAVRDSSYLEDTFLLISSPFRDGTVSLSIEPSVCLCWSVGSPVCLCFPVRKCVEIAAGCLQRGGCVETHCWDTSRVNINCARFDLQCCPQDGP